MQKNITRQKVTYEIIHKYFNFRFHMQNTHGAEREEEQEKQSHEMLMN